MEMESSDWTVWEESRVSVVTFFSIPRSYGRKTRKRSPEPQSSRLSPSRTNPIRSAASGPRQQQRRAACSASLNPSRTPRSPPLLPTLAKHVRHSLYGRNGMTTSSSPSSPHSGSSSTSSPRGPYSYRPCGRISVVYSPSCPPLIQAVEPSGLLECREFYSHTGKFGSPPSCRTRYRLNSSNCRAFCRLASVNFAPLSIRATSRSRSLDSISRIDVLVLPPFSVFSITKC